MLTLARQFLAATILMVALTTTAAADGLFVPLARAQAADAATAAIPGLAVRQFRDVAIDPDYLASVIAPVGVDLQPDRLSRIPPPATVRIELFPGVVVELERTAVSQAVGGGFVWAGEATGPVPVWADLVIRDGRVTGHVSVISAPPRDYRIEPLAQAGLHRISELDSAAFPAESDPVGDDRLAHDEPAAPFGGDNPAGVPDASGPAAITTIDVLVAYTPQAEASVANILAQAELAISLANSGFSRSGVQVRYRVVGLEALPDYTEPSTYATMLNDLSGGQLTQFRALRTLRDSLGADLVAMLAASTESCGIATWPGRPGARTDQLVYSVTSLSCIGNHSFAQGLGRNMGLRDDRFAFAVQPPNAEYNFGYVNVPGRVRTIMASDDACVARGAICTRLNNFSNPSVLSGSFPLGIPAGSPGAANAARWLNEVRATVAAYRTRDPELPPPPPVLPNRPPNDLFDNRIIIPGPGTVTGTNRNATAEPGQSFLGPAVWWAYTPTEYAMVTIDTCGSGLETTLRVFSGRELRWLRLDGYMYGGCAQRSRLQVQGYPGSQIQIAVSGRHGDEGNIRLTLSLSEGVQFPTTTTLQSPSVGTLGQPLTFRATVGSDSGPAQGDVSFRRNGTQFAIRPLNPAGEATATVDSFPAGTYQITAHYLGQPEWGSAPSESAPQTLTVGTAAASTTTTLTGPARGVVGQPLRYSAVVRSPGGTPRGSVNFRRGTAVIATGTLNAQGVATVSVNNFPIGNQQITAVYQGATGFAPSTSAALTTRISSIVSDAPVFIGGGGVFAFTPECAPIVSDAVIPVRVQYAPSELNRLPSELTLFWPEGSETLSLWGSMSPSPSFFGAAGRRILSEFLFYPTRPLIRVVQRVVLSPTGGTNLALAQEVILRVRVQNFASVPRCSATISATLRRPE